MQAQPRAQVSRLFPGGLPPSARLGGCWGWSRRLLALSLQVPGKVQAQAKAAVRGFCEAGPALPDLLLPPGSAPPDLAVAETCRESQPRGRGTWTPGAIVQGLLPPSPPPASAGDVYLALCSLLFSLSLFFSLGVGTPWVQGAHGEPRLTRSLQSKPIAREGSRVAAPVRLRRLPPPALQPGLDGGRVLLLRSGRGGGGG